MCDDLTSPCCVLNPVASKVTCTATGGTANTDPCNILNPIANKTGCEAANAAKTAKTVTGGTSTGTITFIVVGVVVAIVFIILALLVFGGMFSIGAAMQPTGGSKYKSITKFIKRLF